MLKKMALAAIALTSMMPSLAANAQRVCYACIPDAAGGRTLCVIVPCDGSGDPSPTAIPDTKR